MIRPAIVFTLLCTSSCIGQVKANSAQSTNADKFQASVQPFLSRNCQGCHNEKVRVADLDLSSYITASSIVEDRDRWEHILEKLETKQMPPKGSPAPDATELKVVMNWIREEFARADQTQKPNPGRVTARRLNRAEYNNTVRDLLGVDIDPASDFPPDDSGYGFDNIGDALSLSPVLMEKYLSAAEKVARAALFGLEAPEPTVIRYQPPPRLGLDGGDNRRFLELVPYEISRYDVTGLSLPSALHAIHRFPATGDYIFRISPDGNRPIPSDPFPVAVWIDGKQAVLTEFEATTSPTGLEGWDKEVRLHVPAGTHSIAVSALRVFEGLPPKYGGLHPTRKPEPPSQPNQNFVLPPLPENATPEQKHLYEVRKAGLAQRALRASRPPSVTDVGFRVNFIEIKGPYNPDIRPTEDSLRKILVCGHLNGGHLPSCRRRIVTDFARRAYRRPPTRSEVDRLMALGTDGKKDSSSFLESTALALQGALVSPHFLFRIERDPASKVEVDRAVSDHELATRLAYFLWSTTPDGELLRLANQGTLRKPGVVEAQVYRMLKDRKADALVENFGGQWLQFRALESAKPDAALFPNFDNYVRMSMQIETELFFKNIIGEDRPITDFLDAKYTFLNERLAQFYGIRGISGPEFRKVDLTGTPRAGIVTHGSILTISSYSTRTSVVLRGKYILENLLNAPVPPPPPNVPALSEAGAGANRSLREQLEQHRANPSCTSCHSRMDPLGFGLENFDAVGAWRTADGKFPIDTKGTLTDGRTFDGPSGLKDFLASEKDAFTKGITEKMLTYALGRGLERFDRPVVSQIATSVAANEYRFSALVLEIVRSLPFQKTRTAAPGSAAPGAATEVRTRVPAKL